MGFTSRVALVTLAPISLNPVTLRFSCFSLGISLSLAGILRLCIATLVRSSAAWPFLSCLRIPWYWSVPSATALPLVVISYFVVVRHRADDTAEFFYRAVSVVCPLSHSAETLPKSSTFPPLLVSSPSGALQVGQYCDSNSLMYS